MAHLPVLLGGANNPHATEAERVMNLLRGEPSQTLTVVEDSTGQEFPAVVDENGVVRDNSLGLDGHRPPFSAGQYSIKNESREGDKS